MKLYKYKSLQNNGLATSLDIIINKRLYLCDWNKLNDPLEGSFVLAEKIESQVDREKIRSELINEKRKFKVCSLSGSNMHPLMWSHYGDGHSGICIEVDIPDSHPDLKPVNYDLFPPYVESLSADLALRVLTTKGKDWAYEKEFRIISNDEKDYYDNVKVASVSMGMRCSAVNKSILMDVLKKNGIPYTECFYSAGYTIGQFGGNLSL
jgi:hypothetical protein